MSWTAACRAVSILTGRRCNLLDGHEGAHIHGRTAFWMVAVSEEDALRARARLDEVATSRKDNPLLNPVSGGVAHVDL